MHPHVGHHHLLQTPEGLVDNLEVLRLLVNGFVRSCFVRRVYFLLY